MNHWGQSAILACWLACTVLAGAQLLAPRSAISAERVAQALVSGGVDVTAEQVKFLSPVSAAKRDFTLQLVSTARRDKDTLKAELRCHDRACLPFYVLLTGTGMADTQGRNPSARTIAAKAGLGTASGDQILMHDGDSATLVFENTSLRISMSVICLESGSRGQKIRVVSADRKRHFKAEIVALGLLKATV